MAKKNKSKTKNNSGVYYPLWIGISALIVIMVLFKMDKLDFSSVPDLFRGEPEIVEFSEYQMMGAWVWKSPDDMSSGEMDGIFSFAKQEKINTLYVDLGKYSDIADDENGSNEDLDKLNRGVELFLQKARDNSIKVHALGGTPVWANSEQWYIPLSLMDYVIKYNQDNPGRGFDGINYDMEYYNDSRYKDDEALRDSEFLMIVDQLKNKIRSFNASAEQTLRLGIVIPYWFDDDKKTEVFEPLMLTLNDNGGSYISVLAYRNTLRGDNGTLNLARDEIEYADKNTPRVSVVIGQETDDKDNPATTSYFGKRKDDVRRAISGIVDEFGDNPSFGGIAINQLSSFRNLKD